MGVYICGMEMPHSCSDCPMCYDMMDCAVSDLRFWKNREEINEFDFCQERHPSCPLIPVPSHGDLIERDALRASIRESIEECHKWADEVDKDTMMYARISQSLGTFVECSLRAKAAPTIIPAEEGET